MGRPRSALELEAREIESNAGLDHLLTDLLLDGIRLNLKRIA